MKFIIVGGFVLFLSAVVPDVYACNGYAVRINKLQSCDPNSNIVFEPGYTAKLNKDCEVVSKVCVTTKGFKTADATVSAHKDKIKLFEGKKDTCKAAENAQVQQILSILGLDKIAHCPVAAGTYCTDEGKPLSLGKFKNMIAAAKGKILFKSQVDHDNGKSCIEAEIEIYKS